MSTIQEALQQLSLLDESAKTDFIDKFGQNTFNNFNKAKQRLVNKGLSTDYGQYLKKDKKEVDDLILSLYDKKDNRGRDVDSEKRRMLQDTQRQVRGNYKFFGEHDGYLVYQPLDYIASMDLGINTGWCTTGRYRHAGHPEYTPSAKDAKQHFNSYTSKGVKLYYFLNPETFYGEYAIAYLPNRLNDLNLRLVDKTTNTDIILKSTRIELFDSKDNNIWIEPTILKIAKDVLDLDTEINYENIDVIVQEGGFEIKNNKLIKYWGTDSDITIPDTVKVIGNSAFEGCNILTSVTIPNSVKSIKQFAFKNCEQLTTVTLEEGLTSIGFGAFYSCISLDNIKIPNSVTTLDNNAFTSCFRLNNVIISDNLTTISIGAFWDCPNLIDIKIPDKVTSIEHRAFSECDKLTDIEIPSSVTSIGKQTFKDCINLKNIKYNDTMKKWRSILKERDWNKNMKNYTITCTDGIIQK